MNKDDELVLCVERDHLLRVRDQPDLFQGYDPDSEPWIHMLSNVPLQYVRRGDCETEPRFKQLIPYITIGHEWRAGEISQLRYNRTKTSGEDRLIGKASIGIGGHINPIDGINTFQAPKSKA